MFGKKEKYLVSVPIQKTKCQCVIIHSTELVEGALICSIWQFS
jgi:hypothetical protein